MILLKTDTRDIRALFGITFLQRSISIVVTTVSPIILVKILGVSIETVGWMIAGFWIANAAGALIAILVIRNRRSSILVGFVILVIAFVSAANIHDAQVYVGGIMLSGLGLSILEAFLIPSMHESSMASEVPQYGIASYSAALSLGLIAGPLLAAVGIHDYGFSRLFVAFAGISVISFFVVHRTGVQKSFSGEDTRSTISPRNILKVLRKRVFADYYVLNFLYSMLFPILVSYGGIYAEFRFGVGSATVLELFAAMFAISTLLRLLLIKFQPRHFRLLLLASFASLFASFVIMGSADTFLVFLIGILLFSLPDGLIYPITTFMALESGGKESVIASTYIFATSSGIANLISPLAVIQIIALSGFSWAFLGMAPISIVALILAIVFLGQKR